MLHSARKSVIASARRTAASSIGSTRFMSKDIKFGVEGRAAMLNGVNLLADAVQVSEQDGWILLDSIVKSQFMATGVLLYSFFVCCIDTYSCYIHHWLYCFYL